MDKRVFEAAKSGDLHHIRSLNREEIFAKVTPQMSTVLHIAVRYEQKELSKHVVREYPLLLVTANADGDTPLHVAARIGSSEMVQILITGEREDVEIGHRIGEERMLRKKNLCKEDSALHIGVRNGHFEVVKLLIDADEELLGVVNGDKESPLFLAVEGGFFHIAKHILEKFPASLPPCGGYNAMNALHAAVVRTHQASYPFHDPVPGFPRNLVKIFIWHVVELIINPRQTNIDILGLLLEKGANLIQGKDVYGWTPLHCAAHLGHLKATQILLRHCRHASHLKDKEGMSALHIAAKEGHVRVMQEILWQTPEASDVVDNKGWTALHVAVVSEKLEVVKYVLTTPELEVLLNVADKDGNTPLHLAVERENYKITKILMDNRRVDKRVTNLKHLNPIDIVQNKFDMGPTIESWLSMRSQQLGGTGSLQYILHKAEREGAEEYKETTRNEEEQVSKKGVPFPHVATNITPMNKKEKASKSHYLEKMSNTHLLVATLIATVTFTAAFTIPGGYENNEKEKGMSVLSNMTWFKVFVVADSIAFYCSTVAILLQFFSSLVTNYHVLLFATISAELTYISILGMGLAFTSGLHVVMPGSSMLAHFTLRMGGCIVFIAFLLFIIVFQLKV